MGSMMWPRAKVLSMAAIAALEVISFGGVAAASAPALPGPTSAAPVFTVHQIFSGPTVTHTFTPAWTTTPTRAPSPNRTTSLVSARTSSCASRTAWARKAR